MGLLPGSYRLWRRNTAGNGNDERQRQEKPPRLIAVISNKDGIEWANQYEVDFGQMSGTFYQNELHLVKAARQHD